MVNYAQLHGLKFPMSIRILSLVSFSLVCFIAHAAEPTIDLQKPIENMGHNPDAKEPVAINRLSAKYSLQWLEDHIQEPEVWVPYPSLSHRVTWNEVSSPVRKAVLSEAEQNKNKTWAPLTASLALEYLRTGNRADYSAISSERQTRLQNFVLAELIENKGQYLDAIADAIWMISEETYWGIPVHLPQMQRSGTGLPNVQEPTIELFSAERSATLSWTYYLLENRLDKVSPFIRQRITYEINRRILTPFLSRNDFWWMGRAERKDLNNWTPWIISNVLSTALLVEKNTHRRALIIQKCLQILDRYLDGYLPDGGCDEGPGYWGEAAAATFDCLELLQNATGGALDGFHDPLIKAMGHFICISHVAGPWTLNYGDNSALAKPSAKLVQRFGQRTSDETMQVFGAWLKQREGESGETHGNFLRVLPSLLSQELTQSVKSEEPLMRDVYLPYLQLAIARDREGSSTGLYFAMRGYFNAKSHNHNDAGSFMIYQDGEPLFIDPGVEQYTAKTFSPQRYDLWTMQSGYHNLPIINGFMQKNGMRYAATDVTYQEDNKHAVIAMDLAKAYPEEAKISSWKRSLELIRGDKLIITECYKLREVHGPLILNLMTAGRVENQGDGNLIVMSGTSENPGPKVMISYNKNLLHFHLEELKIKDSGLKKVWGESLRRIQLIDEHPNLTGSYTLECKKLN